MANVTKHLPPRLNSTNCKLCCYSTNSCFVLAVPAAVQENTDQAVCRPGHQETAAGGTGSE